MLGLGDELRAVVAADDLRGATNPAPSGLHPKRAQDIAHRSDINLTLSRYTHTVIADRAAALVAVSELARQSDVERPPAGGIDHESLWGRD